MLVCQGGKLKNKFKINKLNIADESRETSSYLTVFVAMNYSG